MPQICGQCGNLHLGPCATQSTCFIWQPQQKNIPKQVLIKGSWKKWQAVEFLNRQVDQDGQVFFVINLTLSPGIYQYKYIVDGQWKVNENQPTVLDQFGNCNNTVKVYPKKMYLPMNKQGQIRITSNLLIEGLQLIGSWDNWTNELPMARILNNLVNRQQMVVYVPVEANKQYEFKFKLKKQYLIDQKFPTTSNQFNSQNNIIITTPYSYQEHQQGSAKKTNTPNKNLSAHYKNPRKDFACKSFEWVTIGRQFDMPYKRVQGHSMCAIGDYLYIFGGFCRSEYYNSLTKLNIQLNSAKTQQALPEGRAFHNMVNYGNKIIIFGGHCTSILQNYYSFNVSELKWVAVPHISGQYPQKTQKQSCVLYDMLMVFFGGYYCSPDFEYQVCYNHISVLDIQHMRWIDKIQVTGLRPRGRFAHTATLMDDDMYIFGGLISKGLTQKQFLNDIWKINLAQDNELSWVEVKSKGKKPCPRHGHSMNALHQYLVIFGGHSDKDAFLNDVFIFNTFQNQWFEPMISGTIPRGRYYHAAATVTQHDEIVVFGGRTSYNKSQNMYILRPNQKIMGLDINQQQADYQ